jgi:putative hydroxymethylpyrimidine transport system permease protein
VSAGNEGGRLARVAAPLALVAALLGIWEVLAQTGVLADGLGLDSFLVPAPSEIATSLWEDRSLLADNAWVTIREVFAGFAAALVVGVGLAAALHLSPLLRRALYPLIVASQTVPIVVVAPIFVVWFGFGIGPKVAVIALICFFPIVVNALDGLATTEADQRKLMRSLGAGRLRTFRELEAPTALPFLLSGAKIAVAVAVIGAVFGEWAGSDSGLGHLMLLDNGQLEVARLFASVVVLSAIAIALFGLLSLAERKIAWWGKS